MLHKEKNDGRSEEKENAPTVTDLTTGTVMSVVEMERNVAIEAVSPILNEVERRERMSMKEEGEQGDEDDKRGRQEEFEEERNEQCDGHW